ncbi:unnamed protein product [Didymodactylos carnosus]|uniref:Uncharacterized protein n=1 Tax=Didymodactylos carnosus TaxID=1234261 RepID=A0A814THW0_9BILA|nr:unnamed protein product [Didymodactylos carnosus]CAF1521978.1 unnamed protein product [Didymodactylos carnosus]CAF3926017.1 unnamed protein product [Didymodactylos carnosus]CAF4308928.1 unnamed protein product [Didymodactylos carnosus]
MVSLFDGKSSNLELKSFEYCCKRYISWAELAQNKRILSHHNKNYSLSSSTMLNLNCKFLPLCCQSVSNIDLIKKQQKISNNYFDLYEFYKNSFHPNSSVVSIVNNAKCASCELFKHISFFTNDHVENNNETYTIWNQFILKPKSMLFKSAMAQNNNCAHNSTITQQFPTLVTAKENNQGEQNEEANVDIESFMSFTERADDTERFVKRIESCLDVDELTKQNFRLVRCELSLALRANLQMPLI